MVWRIFRGNPGQLFFEFLHCVFFRCARGRCRTAKEIERRLVRTLEPVFEKPAADIRRRDLRDLLDQKADEGFPREAEQRRISLGTMFRWAVGQDYIEADPTAGLATYGRSSPRKRVLAELGHFSFKLSHLGRCFRSDFDLDQ